MRRTTRQIPTQTHTRRNTDIPDKIRRNQSPARAVAPEHAADSQSPRAAPPLLPSPNVFQPRHSHQPAALATYYYSPQIAPSWNCSCSPHHFQSASHSNSSRHHETDSTSVRHPRHSTSSLNPQHPPSRHPHVHQKPHVRHPNHPTHAPHHHRALRLRPLRRHAAQTSAKAPKPAPPQTQFR